MDFFINNLWLFGLAFFSGLALLWPALRSSGANLSLLQAVQLINQGKGVVVDVRPADEFAKGHILSSKNLPLQELPKKITILDKFKSKHVILVCAAGNRSSKAASFFKNAGFNHVYSLQGGLTAWQAQGLPTSK